MKWKAKAELKKYAKTFLQPQRREGARSAPRRHFPYSIPSVTLNYLSYSGSPVPSTELSVTCDYFSRTDVSLIISNTKFKKLLPRAN